MKKQLLKMMLLLCALIVGSSAWATDLYIKVAASTDLVSGETYIIANSNGIATSYATKLPTTNSGYTEADGVITLTTAEPLEFTLGTSGDNYTLVMSDGKYLGYSGSSTNFRNSQSNANAKNEQWTIAYNETYSMYTIVNVQTSTRHIGYSGSNTFGVYADMASYAPATLYKKTTVSGAIDPVVSISTSKIAIGSTAKISGPDGLSLSFESDDNSIATVTDAGIVTGVATGSTTITATWSAVTDTYNAGSKEFTVTVYEATVYEKVTGTCQLVAGNEYIIVATDKSMAMGEVDGTIRKNVSVTIVDDKIAISDDDKVAVVTLGGSTDAWTFLASDNSLYLALTSASNAIHTSEDASANTAKWKITSDFQIQSVSQSTRYIQYNSSSPRFACYTGGQTKAYLFVKVGSKAVLSLNSACTDGDKYYGTFSTGLPFVVPSDLTVSAVTVDGSTLTLVDYATDDVVPANTGVLISSTTAGEHTVTLSAEAGTAKTGNKLLPSGDDGLTAAAMSAASTKFYRLTMHNGTTLGFWWGAADGAAFDIAANKAYLAVPEGAGVREGFLLGDDTVTSVNEGLRVKNGESAAAVYNLSGQRVAQPTKGLYIINGKKVVVK